MSDSDTEPSGRSRDGSRGEETVEAIAESTLRIVLLVLGLLLLFYAVGQAVGFDVLALLSEALATPAARWMIVAFFALILIAMAIRGFR